MKVDTGPSDDCQHFYDARDRRTVEYVGQTVDQSSAVHVAVDAATCTSASGQLLLLALANELARVHRRVSFNLFEADAPTLAKTPFRGDKLAEVLLTTVSAIDPCGDYSLGPPPPDRAIRLGIGVAAGRGLHWYLGADRAVASLSRSPVAVLPTPATSRGAGLAACLGAAAAFRACLGAAVNERTLSAWNFAEGAEAAHGPDDLDPFAVGRVLMVGAGAVGASLAFWLHAFGADCHDWSVVDGDMVELHNTNRGLVFTPQHAGWPHGDPANKARLVATLMPGSTPYDRWYHECDGLRDQQFDIVLALANDYDARERLTQRHAAISLQATTGENWLSQLHRHILGRDGCVACRTGELRPTSFSCSSAVVQQPGGSRTDAALPFLSAASGLMLATALERLANGELEVEAANCWSWDFSSAHLMAARPVTYRCRESCARVPPLSDQERLVRGTRWGGLVARA